MGNFKEDIAKVEAMVFDVDGVMTDGRIIPTAEGDFIRCYNCKDGYALAYAANDLVLIVLWVTAAVIQFFAPSLRLLLWYCS